MITENMNPNNEEIEGLGKDEDASLGDYPIDTLLIRNEPRTVHEVLRRIKSGGYVMSPDFQRDFIWSDDKQSKLIESVLMRIPLPVFYLGEDDQGRMIVVDGLQRLSTFDRFVNNKLRLKLPQQTELDNKLFRHLSPKLQNRVEDCNLILYIIDAKVPDRARLDIFERVNSGVPLTRQQMRNCLYDGKATRFLKEEAATELFKKATGNSLSAKTMRDREFVNRFCAFRILPLNTYKDDMDEWLAMALKEMNKFDEASLLKLSSEFRNSLQNNFMLFNEHAFRKHIPGQAKRGILNASLWDVMITGLAQYSNDQVKRHAHDLKSYFYILLEDDAFVSSITYGPNSTSNVKIRFEATQVMFKEVLGANAS
ncbi:MAG: DUF262 domain-containing protein [Nitrosomonas sp.]|uniref:DUF262 domain-containing protein n=1 Tax=Nitrosomonas sp. TaxID=42353 RepID=UPI0027357C97|nr:DUF262 domain-containing protein [Nitrosomonas sp.]MDP3280100.1 DUF262 domain-containing protein [Nitrosomonas sp.]MDP3664103.1 DUF262 domain-containing protein [Nitrosomonas sp.]MDZ4105440.1 DUF262 domain-containing protein [Nitrosomonas sp.]